MRRAGPKNRKRKYRWKLAGVLLAAAALFAAVDSQLRPVVETMAQYQCRVVSAMCIRDRGNRLHTLRHAGTGQLFSEGF